MKLFFSFWKYLHFLELSDRQNRPAAYIISAFKPILSQSIPVHTFERNFLQSHEGETTILKRILQIRAYANVFKIHFSFYWILPQVYISVRARIPKRDCTFRIGL
jgi:hypothetical protein